MKGAPIYAMISFNKIPLLLLTLNLQAIFVLAPPPTNNNQLVPKTNSGSALPLDQLEKLTLSDKAGTSGGGGGPSRYSRTGNDYSRDSRGSYSQSQYTESRGSSRSRNTVSRYVSKPQKKSAWNNFMSHVAILVNLHSLANSEVLITNLSKTISKLTNEAASARATKEKMLDTLKLPDAVEFMKEEQIMRKIEVALAYQRMLATIYEAISQKKWKHKAKAASVKAKIKCDDCDYPLRQQYEAEVHQGQHIQEALNSIKDDYEFVNKAKDPKQRMDLLQMFNELSQRRNVYYRLYFMDNTLDDFFEFVDIAAGAVDNAYDILYARVVKEKPVDPGVTGYIQDARIGGRSRSRDYDTSRGRSRSRDRGTYSRGSSRSRSTDGRKSRGRSRSRSATRTGGSNRRSTSATRGSGGSYRSQRY